MSDENNSPAEVMSPEDMIARNRRLTAYPEKKVLELAELANKLGVLIHIDGFPFGRSSGDSA